MSTDAPWLALSVDWQDSAMLDDATHGERLAWVCLLCHAKSQGRGGRVRLRKNAFQTAYRLSERAVMGMLERAQKCAAIEVNGDFISLCNWGTYQGKLSSKQWRERCRNEKTTKATATVVLGAGGVVGAVGGQGGDDPPWLAEVLGSWVGYKSERGQRYKPKGMAAIKREMLEHGEAWSRAAVQHSMACNYAGLFPPKGSTNGSTENSPARIAAKPGKYAHIGKPVGSCDLSPADDRQGA